MNLRGKYDKGNNRDETLAGAEAARKLAYRHTGRFDAQTLAKLDQRNGINSGDQFNYRLNKNGTLSGNSREALAAGDFIAMLDAVETSLKTMGQSVYEGVAKTDPFRKGTTTACDQCDYHSICRLDPWTHSYRVLRKTEEEQEA